VAAGEHGLGLGQRARVDVGEHDAGALAQQALGGGRADAPCPAGDERDAAGEALRLRHALELRLLQQPVFDVEGLLLREAAVLETAEAPRITLMALT
jgi:hypothetical protein